MLKSEIIFCCCTIVITLLSVSVQEADLTFPKFCNLLRIVAKLVGGV